MEMEFKEAIRHSLEEQIPKDHDDYDEIEYSDTLYVHVWSHPDGKGAFELSVIVPYDHEGGYDEDANTLAEVPGTEKLYQLLKTVVEDVTGNTYPNFAFYLTEQVTDGTWERDANVYETHKLES